MGGGHILRIVGGLRARSPRLFRYHKEMMRSYMQYLKDNPEGYWFKAKLYGWGWVPVKWQGWLVVGAAVALIAAGFTIGEADDAPGAALLGILLACALLLGFGYAKGEKPRWQWGPPKDKEGE